ncbi:PIG-X [Mycena alexandri]|uniref:Protein PBN1 n=1 Tax=Mycena alexandri TaxID=1745969 RepID=A0AAD6X3U6_9AGAR|nr:PIG-X [Mycena alexandri]
MQSSSLLHAESFHPLFKTQITAPDFKNCSLHLHYFLPRSVFVDPYELSNRANDYSFKYSGPSNLELPVAALRKDAALLLSIIRPLSDDGILDVEVPLHMRYGTAAIGSSFELTELPWPDAFFACNKSVSSARLPPMLREFAMIFDGMDIARLEPPSGAIPFETVRTPVGDTANVGRVELGTAIVMLVAFFYLLRATLRTMGRMSIITLPAKEG